MFCNKVDHKFDLLRVEADLLVMVDRAEPCNDSSHIFIPYLGMFNSSYNLVDKVLGGFIGVGSQVQAKVSGGCGELLFKLVLKRVALPVLEHSLDRFEVDLCGSRYFFHFIASSGLCFRLLELTVAPSAGLFLKPAFFQEDL